MGSPCGRCHPPACCPSRDTGWDGGRAATAGEDHGQWDRRGLLLPVQHAAMSHSTARSAVRMLIGVCSVVKEGLLESSEPWGEADSFCSHTHAVLHNKSFLLPGASTHPVHFCVAILGGWKQAPVLPSPCPQLGPPCMGRRRWKRGSAPAWLPPPFRSLQGFKAGGSGPLWEIAPQPAPVPAQLHAPCPLLSPQWGGSPHMTPHVCTVLGVPVAANGDGCGNPTGGLLLGSLL